MFNNVAFDVVPGLVFIYLLYCLLATIILELISHVLDLRPRMLTKALHNMLQDRDETKGTRAQRLIEHISNNLKHVNYPLPENTLTKAFYKHPGINYLAYSIYRSKPSYINPANFSSTLVKILRGEEYDGTQPQMNSIRATLFEFERVYVGDTIGSNDHVAVEKNLIDTELERTLDWLLKFKR